MEGEVVAVGTGARNECGELVPLDPKAGDRKTAERAPPDGTLRHSGQSLMLWVGDNARVDPKRSAILVTKQASGRANIIP
jgi:hypothetical protein